MSNERDERVLVLRHVEGLDQDVSEQLADHPLFATLSAEDLRWLSVFDVQNPWALEELLAFYKAARAEQGIEDPSIADVVALMTASRVNTVLQDADEELVPVVADYFTLCVHFGVKQIPYDSGFLAES